MTASVLIVEDDKDIRKNLKRLLESEGYAVTVAENGKVALENLQAAAELPDLILLDLTMPVMDGFQFREEQEKIVRLAGIPVAIMTADGRLDDKRILTKASAALRKPANADDILKMVAMLVRQSSV